MRSRAPVPLALLLILLTAVTATVGAQDWRGAGRVQGTVLDEDSQPVAGARVTLRQETGAKAGPPPAATDAEGRWSLIGLAGGRWEIAIEAEGFQTANGWVQVAAEGSSPSVEVELLPLSIVSPAFSEGNPNTIRGWLEKGNSLLGQGQYAAARAEYEKALQVLPMGERAEVYRSVARTYYLEGDQEAAVDALKRALLAADDAATRQLFTVLLEGLGRGEEAQAWLDRLASEGPDALAAELGVGEEAGAAAGPPSFEEPEPEAPQANRKGAYSTSFAERSPLSRLETIAGRYTLEIEEILAADPQEPRYDLAEETFDVFVPESYDPATPAPLVVWISPTSRGGIRSPDLMAVLEEKGMIWVGANRSGNPRSKWARLGLALDAAHGMRRFYNIDPERIYVSGYSGGGRTASALAVLFPEVFRGVLCLMGVDFYAEVPIPHRPGAHWVPAFPPPAEASAVRERNRYVLVTGELDFNRAQTKAYFKAYRKEGFKHVTYLEIPGASHYTRMPAEWFARALDALEGREASGPAG